MNEAEGLEFHSSPLTKIQLYRSFMFPSFRMTLNTGPFDVNMQLIAVALAVTVAVAALAFKSHAARRILDVVCNVRQNARFYG